MNTGCLILFIFLFSDSLFAQKQDNIWYFGDKAGIDFNTSPPTPIKSELTTLEGTASICDPEGHLLFYTNGTTVWDRTHLVMPNGTGLLGAESSTQAALIVPLPRSCNQYYLFATEDHYTNGGLTYSIVDMCLNGGLGDVIPTKKNILVQDQTAEKITAIPHSNGTDIWIITHLLGSNKFLAYLLTAAGLNNAPVISNVGSFYPVDGHIGPVKASHDNKKIASSASFRGICELFDFNATTGLLSNSVDILSLLPPQQFVYGIEFSPNDSLLYLSTFFVTNNLFQINLRTKQVVTLNSISGNYVFGMLQMGPDRKIYMARNGTALLDVIHDPNRPGPACQYDEGGQVLLPGTSCLSGLPNFPPYSFFLSAPTSWSLGKDTSICEGDTLSIHLDSPLNCPDSYVWNDGSASPDRIIFQPGTYWVEISNSCFHETDTFRVSRLSPPVFLVADTSFCQGDTISIHLHNAQGTILWSTGSTDTSIQIFKGGTYWLELSNICFSMHDDFQASALSIPTITLQDTVLCTGGMITLSAEQPMSTFHWSDQSVESSIFIRDPGRYAVTVTNPCGQDSASVLVESVDCDFSVYVPNVFTPNADGINDIIRPYISKSIEHYVFAIFDRWGNCVFISSDSNSFWDGTFKQKLCESGVYAYSLDYTSVFGDTKHLQGDITLIR